MLIVAGAAVGQTTAWMARYGGTADGTVASLTDIAVDASGNVYATGVDYYPTSYYTVKYNSEGTALWAARLAGRPTGIAVDAAGNAYVTGSSGGDFGTVKYNTAGVQQWVARFDGPGGVYETATAIALDGAGNVLVTGGASNGANSDIVTIKYDQSGNQLWVRTFNGAANADDGAAALAIDAAGNVYVSGSSSDGSKTDYVTIKYSSAGAQEWAATYNGPANDDDGATAIGVDAIGNVYVTGSSSGTSLRQVTIKYSSAGVQQWVAAAAGDGGAALAVTADGSAYVAGTWYFGYSISKYTTAGTSEWSRRPTRIEGSGLWVTGLALEPDDSVVVVGYIQNGGPLAIDGPFIDKYSATGALEWWGSIPQFGDAFAYALAVAVGPTGTIYLGGLTTSGVGIDIDNDFLVEKYAPEGFFGFPYQLWSSKEPQGGDDGPAMKRPVAVDGGGNVHVTGGSRANSYSSDFLTVKHNAAGALVWARTHDGGLGQDDSSNAVAVDGGGNVYVTGSSRVQSDADYDIATVKYDAGGAREWTAVHGGAAKKADGGSDIAVDAGGNVYVTGTVQDTSSSDCVTMKYNPGGARQWLTTFTGAADGNDWATSVAVDADGNVYITGSTSTASGRDCLTVKYSNAGVQQWVATYSGAATGHDDGQTIAVDTSGDVYVTASSSNGTNYDFATIKYNAGGVEQWVARYNDPANRNDYVNGLVVGEAGNVYVTGQSYNGANWDYATVKYNAAGVQQWVARLDGDANGDDKALALAVDAGGSVYVTGESSNGTDLDYLTVKYDAAGAQQWLKRFGAIAGKDDGARGIALDASDSVVVTGYSPNVFDNNDFLTIKYAQPVAVIGFTATTSTVAESAGAATAEVRLTTASGQPLAAPASVSYATANGSATAPQDFASTAGVLTFPAGTPSGATQTISVPIVPDAVHESDETFTIGLSNPSGAELGEIATRTVTILDDDLPCSLSCSAQALPASGVAPLLTSFSSQVTTTSCLAAPVTEWAFGDGASSAAANPEHSYLAPGSYTWTLTVTADDQTCTSTGSVIVTACSLACPATVTPSFGPKPLDVQFSVAAADSCGGTPVIAWTTGDGGASSAAAFAHTFTNTGDYPWTLSVTSGDQVCSQSGSTRVVSRQVIPRRRLVGHPVTPP